MFIYKQNIMIHVHSSFNFKSKPSKATATFKNISVLLVEETGVWEKTTDLSQVPCKRCIENTFLERDFN
jgi:hypothetical protein